MRSLQNENLRNDAHNSSPNTPESMRRSSNFSRHASSSPIQLRSGASEKVNGNARGQLTFTAPAPLKKEKMEFNERMMRMGCGEGRPLSYHGKSQSSLDSTGTPSGPLSPLLLRKRSQGPTPVKGRTKDVNLLHRRSMPVGSILENRIRDKFDLSELDTNLPRIDLEAIETHLRLAGEEDRKEGVMFMRYNLDPKYRHYKKDSRFISDLYTFTYDTQEGEEVEETDRNTQRRSDRDEIRRRLALESDDLAEKSISRKPSLHSRLQSSMNLQICFMNETASDSESPGSDTETTKNQQQPGSLPYISSKAAISDGGGSGGEDFYARQAKLQADARQALSQAKDLARIQMSHEREQRRYSPITEMVRNSLQKVGMTLSPERRRLSRQLLTEMNVAQLQVIVNDLHNHIEDLNEKLVSMLLDRDELHMEQDSMLVDIEDLSRYLAAKETSPHQSLPMIPPPKSLLLGRK